MIHLWLAHVCFMPWWKCYLHGTCAVGIAVKFIYGGVTAMELANIIVVIVSWIVAFVLGAIALWAFKRNDPMHFWGGSTVKPDELTDVSAYNRANGVMWVVYAVCFFMVGIASLFNLIVAGILTAILCTLCAVALVVTYKKIYSKYKIRSAL